MQIQSIYSLLLILNFIYGTYGFLRSGRKDCTIPRGNLYDRATFRLQYGNAIDPLARGETVGQYNRVVVVCNKDILTDLIIKYHVITCHRGKWKPRMPECSDPKSCEPLEAVDNAVSEVLLGNDIDYPHGTVVRYHCMQGFVLTGNSVRHCQDGIWDEIKLYCTKRPEVPMKCAELVMVENAVPEEEPNTSGEYPHGTVVRYRCREGYRLSGDNKVRCNSGLWSNVNFTCNRVESLKKMCPELTVVNGPVVPMTMSGEYIISCNKGFEFKGHKVISCNNGIWSQPHPECVARSCEPLKDRFEVVNNIGPSNQLKNGSIIRIQCPWSWEPLNGVEEASCINGEWKPESPVCIVFCKLPRRGNRSFTYLKTGSLVNTTRVANWDSVVQHCSVGSKRSTSSCINGRWRPTFKFCPYQQERLGKSMPNTDEDCSLPDNSDAFYINSSGVVLDVTEKVVHGDTVMQVCGQDPSNIAYNVSRGSSCLGGRWVPEFQNCSNSQRTSPVDTDEDCTLPNNKGAFYIHSSGVPLDDVERVEHGEAVMQVCEKGQSNIDFNESRSSSCFGGRWVPEFQNDCSYNCEDSALIIKESSVNLPDRSQVNVQRVGFVNSVQECAKKCTHSTIFSCKSIQVYTYKHDGFSELFCKMLSEMANNISDKFIAFDGSKSKVYNVFCEASSNSTNHADAATCKKPDIQFSTLSPDLEDYYEAEVVTVRCHGNDVHENLTCLTTGQWSNLNITCNAVKEVVHCLPPRKDRMVYWPIKNLYNINDTLLVLTCAKGLVQAGSNEMRCVANDTWEGDFECLTPAKEVAHCSPPRKDRMEYWPRKNLYNINDTLSVLTCAEGLVHAGSREMRCVANDTWEGDFECLTPCENGSPVILATDFHFVDTRIGVTTESGHVSTAQECAANCVKDSTFSCKSIQVYHFLRGGKTNIFCRFISEIAEADAGSRVFRRRPNPGSNIYNVKCNTSCNLPDDIGVGWKHLDGRNIEGNKTVPNGTVLKINCQHRGTTHDSMKQQTTTCIAGKWSRTISDCSD